MSVTRLLDDPRFKQFRKMMGGPPRPHSDRHAWRVVAVAGCLILGAAGSAFYGGRLSVASGMLPSEMTAWKALFLALFFFEAMFLTALFMVSTEKPRSQERALWVMGLLFLLGTTALIWPIVGAIIENIRNGY